MTLEPLSAKRCYTVAFKYLEKLPISDNCSAIRNRSIGKRMPMQRTNSDASSGANGFRLKAESILSTYEKGSYERGLMARYIVSIGENVPPNRLYSVLGMLETLSVNPKLELGLAKRLGGRPELLKNSGVMDVIEETVGRLRRESSHLLRMLEKERSVEGLIDDILDYAKGFNTSEEFWSLFGSGRSPGNQADEMRVRLGKMVRHCREEAGISRAVLGKMIGVGPAYIFRIEAGMIETSVDFLDMITEALGLTDGQKGELLAVKKIEQERLGMDDAEKAGPSAHGEGHSQASGGPGTGMKGLRRTRE